MCGCWFFNGTFMSALEPIVWSRSVLYIPELGGGKQTRYVQID
jgi:hypothetical protein